MFRGAWSVSRVVWFLFRVIVACLLIRILLVAIGVNTGAALVNWFFQLTGWLAGPRSLITWIHDVKYGAVLIEWTVLVAAIAYYIIGRIIIWILRRFGV